MNRFIAYLIENRYANVDKSREMDQKMVAFYNEFSTNYSWPILESHLAIVIGKKEKFVGTKTFCASLKLLCTAIKYKETREMFKDKNPFILHEILLPSMMISQFEYELY